MRLLAGPPPTSPLQRASSGRLRGGPSIWDRRAWKAIFSTAALPAVLLIAVFGVVFAAQMTNGGPLPWGLSGQALEEGRWHTLASHMVTHGGLAHLFMNSSVLLALTPLVMMRLGSGLAAWLRYGVLFAASGLAGAALYLAIHPAGVVPMVGASGAIFGLWGAAARVGPDGAMVSLMSAQVRSEVIAVAKMNLILFVILFALVRISGGVGGLAWEAHIGGFLFGLLVMPLLAPRAVAAPGPATG